VAPDAEVSLEANPGTVDEAHLHGLREAGFNRVSFGVQSFHDAELLDLERIHSGDEAAQAYRWARAAGFDNVNLDLIFGLMGQSMAQWQDNVEQAIALAPDHLSLYALTLEEGTPLTRDVGRGRRLAPDLDLQADMYDWSRERLAGAGYRHYEVSNWALPGSECRHNLAYWRNQDWLGLGAGAHSHLFGRRFAAASTPSRYIALVDEAHPTDATDATASVRGRQPEATLGGPVTGATAASLRGRKPEATFGGPGITALLDSMRQVTYRDEATDEASALRREMSETVILALRLREGLDLRAFERRFGVRIEDAFPEALDETRELNLTEVVDGRLRIREAAVFLGDEAFVRFL
jgi:oxygen-independent coproporphyrinogen-3 oxidase